LLPDSPFALLSLFPRLRAGEGVLKKEELIMKKNKMMSASLLVSALACTGLALVGCSHGASMPTQAEKVFQTTNFYYDTSAETAYNVSVKISSTDSVSAVTCGKIKATDGQYGNRDGVLTLSADFMKQITAGEKTVKVTAGSKTISLNLFAASKVVTTAQEFQDINKNLTGYFILGNDIDLSSIANFEPLGFYFTETDTNNAYFHGVLEGNGYTVKNAKSYWSDTTATNYGVYSGSGAVKFSSDAHKNGDNVGLFQVIGSSGVVRDVNFQNINIRGRTIVGAIAGNCMGTVMNCTVDGTSKVEMGTHYYDDDCNMGGAFGIVAGSGNVSNVICQCTSQVIGATGASTVNGVQIEKAGIYLDWNNDYVGKTGNGWDHGTPETNDNPWWKQCAVDKEYSTTASTLTGKVKDSNGSQTDGQYAFVGKCWGNVSNCVAKKFQITPMDGTARDICFGQTHLAANKSTSGDSDLGALTNDILLDDAGLKSASNYASYDTSVWSIKDGSVPSLVQQYTIQ
jgi:hypothetical protein